MSRKWVLPRTVFSIRVALHLSILCLLTVSPCGLPGAALLAFSEFEVPFDQDESSVEAALSPQARTRPGCHQPGAALQTPLRADQSLPRPGIVEAPRSGHRLSLELLAPLRC